MAIVADGRVGDDAPGGRTEQDSLTQRNVRWHGTARLPTATHGNAPARQHPQTIFNSPPATTRPRRPASAPGLPQPLARPFGRRLPSNELAVKIYRPPPRRNAKAP